MSSPQPIDGDRLSRNEMQQVADHYTTERGVNYRQFCLDVDTGNFALNSSL